MPQRLMKPRTNTNSLCLVKGETSSTKATPNDYTEDARLSMSNDSPLSFTGPGSFYHNESPSRSATNLSNQGVRSRSRNASSSSNKRQSAVLDSDVDVAAAIALLQELKKRASPEDLILLHKALLPTRNADRATSPAETKNEEPISPLIRRSSLLPAGVKTRLSRELLRNFSDKNVTARSASSSRQYDPTESPRLDVPLHFEALDLADGVAETQGGRSVTPSDFFPQIGSLRMGSLRVTNGAPSPEPSLLLDLVEMAGKQEKAAVRPSESASGDGFVTADEGESSPECVRPSRATVVSLRAPRKSSEQKESRAPSNIRARSKSRGHVRRSSEDEVNQPMPHQSSRPRAAQRASEYAQEYTSEFETLENPHMSSPALTTTVSRLSTVHDESPTDEGVGSREEALRRLTGEVPQHGERGQKHLSVGRPPMAKSDSGYSSEASRRSIVKESHCDEFLMAALDAADQAERTRSKGSPALTSARPSLEQIKEDKVSSPTSPYIQQQISSVQKAERHRSLPSFFTRKSASSTSVNTIAAAPVTPAKQTKKLQKTRPQSQIVVPQEVNESKPEPDLEFVPGAAEDLSVNFSRPTRKSDRPSASPQAKPIEEDNDRRGRGRSRKQDAKSQHASPEGSPDETTRRRSRSFFRFRSRSRSKSQHRREDDVTVLSVSDEPLPTHNFSDFGTVAQSLGQSPYDIATRRVKQMGAYDPAKPWYHPHEISRAAPEPDSSSDAQAPKNKGKSVERGQQDRACSQSRPRESIDTVLKSSRPPTRGKSRRSQSVHNIAVSRVPEPMPELPKQTETMSGTFSRPSSKDGNVRVGTIDLGTGFAQGRLEPILTKTEKAKTRRRTQSVSPRARPNAVSPMIPEEPMPQSPTQPTQAPREPKLPQVTPRELPQVPVSEPVQTPSEEPSTVAPRELPQIPAREPPKVPAHRKKLDNLPPALSVSTTPVQAKEPAPVPQTPASPASPTARSSWDSQALAWRQRKQSIGEMLSSPTTEKKSFASRAPASPAIQAYSPTFQAPRCAPTVIVSRYITPQGSEFAMHLGDDPYSDLHTDNPTDLRPAQQDVERTDSSSTYRTATSERSQDSFASNDSAKYRAYRPEDVMVKDQLSGASTPKSNTTQKRSSRAFDQLKRRSTAPPEQPTVPFDRFSGGLGYGWERGVGFGGSAGTRQKNDTKASRKSVAISQSYGVDLSDVPVFMVRQ